MSNYEDLLDPDLQSIIGVCKTVYSLKRLPRQGFILEGAPLRAAISSQTTSSAFPLLPTFVDPAESQRVLHRR